MAGRRLGHGPVNLDGIPRSVQAAGDSPPWNGGNHQRGMIGFGRPAEHGLRYSVRQLKKERTGMAQFTIAGAARAAGVGRATIQRALKAGRLSATTNEQGERVIDMAELLRVFGPLKQGEQPASSITSQLDTGGEQGLSAVLVEVLREQLRKAEEREQQAQQEKARLLSLLEAEQQARRDLEQKLLPPPPPHQPELPPRRHHRLWLLLAILALAIAALVWTRTSAYWPLGA